MNYLNPASLLQQSADFRTNPMQGALAGMNIGAGLNLLDRSYRDSDLDYMKSLHDLEMAKAQDPQKLAEIAAGIQSAKNQLSVLQDPRAVQAQLSDLDTKMDDNSTKQVGNSMNINQARNILLDQMNTELQAHPLDYTKDPSGSAQRWQDWQEKFSKVKMRLPPMPDPEFMSALPAKAAAAKQSLEYQRQLGLIGAKGDIEKSVAKIHAQGSVSAAQAKPKTAAEDAQREYLEKNGPEALLQLLAAQKMANPALNNIMMKLAMLSGDPKKMQEALDLIQKMTGMSPGQTTAKEAPKSALEPAKSPEEAKARVDAISKAYPKIPRQAIIQDMIKKGIIPPGDYK